MKIQRGLVPFRFISAVTLALMLAGAAEAIKPDAEQVGAVITNYGNKWLATHVHAGYTTHWRTDTDPQQARWEGDVYVCRFEGAVIPTTPGAIQGTLFSGELRIYVDPDDGALKCDAPGAQFGLLALSSDLRVKFPHSTSGADSSGWTQLLHLTLNSNERGYSPDNPLGPIQAGTFAVPGPGELRITYSYRVHDYGPLGGLDWDLGRGPTRDLPGIGTSRVRTPELDPPPGGTVTLLYDKRRCGPMPKVSASLTPRAVPAGFANAIYGKQLADYQELTVAFRPDGAANAPVTGTSPTTAPSVPTAPVAPSSPQGATTATGTATGTPFVVDQAGVLDTTTAMELGLVLQILRERAGRHLAVVFIPSAEDSTAAGKLAVQHRDKLIAAGVLPSCSGVLLFANGGELRGYGRSADFEQLVPLDALAAAWHQASDQPWPQRVAAQLRGIYAALGN